jgi:hypothetical protein
MSTVAEAPENVRNLAFIINDAEAHAFHFLQTVISSPIFLHFRAEFQEIITSEFTQLEQFLSSQIQKLITAKVIPPP